MKIPYINLKAEHKALKKQILKEVAKVLDSANFILGPEVQEFEKNAAKYCGTKYAVGLNSGTDALFLALKVLGVGPGDEVITAPNSFVASASVIVAVGAVPVFVDVRDDMNINPDLIEEKITSKTKAIMPVNLTGKMCDMDRILSIAEKHNLYVVEDSAQSIGAEYRGKRAGSFGDVNCFSLHPLKTLNACGDAGFITTNDEEIYTKLTKLRNIGMKNRNEVQYWGYNSRLDSIQAAIINLKFKKLDSWIKARRKIADYYRKNLRGLAEKGLIMLPSEDKHEKPAYHTFIIQVDKRDELQQYLLENGVETKIHYPIPIHLQEAAKGLGYKEGDFPVIERQVKRILSLPVYQELTKKQQDYIITQIKGFFGPA
ncbi:MAG: hypothetical protein A2297_06735 [Elusimicrobia bacterium RIFOXYB2_FULL_48_7]|nr:MAG: hypothetical protein A2297_06735 [Elusimicrobia bacterium RIFOXYB2_FULL_48_7]